jgi:hypothetical protein
VDLVVDYLASVAPETFATHDSDWHRWNHVAPPKRLLALLVGVARTDSVEVEHLWAFGQGFMTLAESTDSPATRYFRDRRETNDVGAYVLDFYEGSVLMNELLRKFDRAYLSTHTQAYVRGFFLRSVGGFFYSPLLTREGAYTYRVGPDKTVETFWPGHDSRRWKPRVGDPAAALVGLHRSIAPLGWIAVAVALAIVWIRRPAQAWSRPMAFALVLLAFALSYGVTVAWSHMMEIRYQLPVRPFLLAAVALVLPARGTARGASGA